MADFLFQWLRLRADTLYTLLFTGSRSEEARKYMQKARIVFDGWASLIQPAGMSPATRQLRSEISAG
jgi:hypothetical protein